MKKRFFRFSTVRMQLVGSVFLLITPALLLMYIFDLPMRGFVVGLLALAASWFGGEHFILRQVRVLSQAAQRLASGDLSVRTGVAASGNELSQLAETFDRMAASLQKHVKDLEDAEKKLLNRALQQSAVAGLEQFALTKNDVEAMLVQAAIFVAQTLEVEFSAVWERLPDGQLLLRAGVGWKDNCVGQIILPAENRSQMGFTLNTGEAGIVADIHTNTRFVEPPLFAEHGIVSGVAIVILTRRRPFGVFSVHSRVAREFSSDEVQFLMTVANAIGTAVERQRADAELQKLAAFAQLDPNAAMELDADGNITYYNDAAQKLALTVRKNHPREILPDKIEGIIRECLSTGRSKQHLETKMNGRTFSWAFHPVIDLNVLHCYAEDITEWLSLEEQLRQSQKMDSVGQLAAGVAHDFNNMLTVIQGHTGALLAKAKLPSEALDSLHAVFFAAERAASLTRQLLMFSRKNIMQPRLLDLREVVGDMSSMLQRLLGETIKLEFAPPAKLPLIEGDTGMIEQVIVNLSVNARDAMLRGGTLTIGVESVDIDAAYTQTHPEARAGRFVCLRVKDTGCGMDSATLSHLFEPFFTTKEVGRGTGLGLATVYGIVKQHAGWIEVSSEPGKGATFAVFFPAREEVAAAPKMEIVPATPVPGGTETILIVEDEPVLREMARTVLEECGYHILEASSGREALNVWNQHPNEIDLLVTDMVMPEGLSGKELAEQLLASQPRLKVIFTSGYTGSDVSPELLAKTHALYLPKPYTDAVLARAVRECLDRNFTTSSMAAA
jgi:signal transduction histidine kinase/HAMP domain-containing protein/ActR/RegA family two-component response regulator